VTDKPTCGHGQCYAKRLCKKCYLASRYLGNNALEFAGWEVPPGEPDQPGLLSKSVAPCRAGEVLLAVCESSSGGNRSLPWPSANRSSDGPGQWSPFLVARTLENVERVEPELGRPLTTAAHHRVPRLAVDIRIRRRSSNSSISPKSSRVMPSARRRNRAA
jgi:hypothetical protein